MDLRSAESNVQGGVIYTNFEEFKAAYAKLKSEWYGEIKVGKATLKQWKIARLRFINENKPKDWVGRKHVADLKKRKALHEKTLEKTKEEIANKLKQKKLIEANK